MYTTKLRKVGGSVMLAIPPALLNLVNLRVEDKVNVDIENSRIVVEPRTRPNYTLDELLAQCESDCILTEEDREWDEAKPLGNELL